MDDSIPKKIQQGSSQPVVLAGNGTVNVRLTSAVGNHCQATKMRTSKALCVHLAYMETKRMTSAILKARAKNLRNALKCIHELSVTHSQALELVAKEENYPNWDAACASFKPDDTRHASSQIEFESSDNAIQHALAAAAHTGSLVVIWGTAKQGKTTTLQTIINNHLMQLDSEKPQCVLHIGAKEFSYPDVVAAHCYDDFETALQDSNLSSALIAVDEMRDARTAFQVVALVSAGAKVVVALHAAKPLVRIATLLRGEVIGKVLFDSLLKANRVLTVRAKYCEKIGGGVAPLTSNL